MLNTSREDTCLASIAKSRHIFACRQEDTTYIRYFCLLYDSLLDYEKSASELHVTYEELFEFRVQMSCRYSEALLCINLKTIVFDAPTIC